MAKAIATEFTPSIASLLGDYTYYRLWKPIKRAQAKGIPVLLTSNTLDFDYDPQEDSFKVYVNFSDGRDAESSVVMTTENVQRGLTKYARGAP